MSGRALVAHGGVDAFDELAAGGWQEPPGELGDELAARPDAVAGLGLVLSHLFGTSGTNYAYFLAIVLRRYAHTKVHLPGGISPAPHPELAVDASTPRDAERLTGLTSEAYREAWNEHVLDAGGDVPLPTKLVLPLLPAELWRVLLRLVADGPRLAAARVERLLLAEAKREIRRPDRRRGGQGGAASDATLRHLGHAALALFRTLHALAGRSVLLGHALAAWDREPLALQIPSSDVERTDTTAPRRHQVRALWQRVDADVRRLLPGAGDELQAVGMLSATGLRRAGLFKALRLRVLLLLLAVPGLRVGAIVRLTRGDYDPQHRGPDGEHGPALRTRPGKTRHSRLVSWKPLPPAAAAVIETWLAYTTRRCPELGPMSPLLLADATGRGWGKGAITDLVGGHAARRDRKMRAALLPRDPGDPSHGYTCHTFRSAAAQMTRSLEAHGWLVERRVSADPHWMAEALLDHALSGMPALYGGASKPEDRERLAGLAIEVNWLLLTTELGARKGHDGDAYRRAREAHAALLAESARLGRLVDEAFEPRPAPPGAEVEQRLLERIEDLMRVQGLARRERQVLAELVDVERELERLRHDPRRLIALADDPPEQPVDLDAIDATVSAGAAREIIDELAPRRDWISVPELGYVAGVAGPTARRWVDDPPRLPFPDGDPRNPWPADRVPVDDSLGARRRRVIADGIADSFLRADPRRRERLAEVRSTAGPEGWSPEHCAAPLLRPTWLP